MLSSLRSRSVRLAVLAAPALFLALPVSAAPPSCYEETDLVADQAGTATNVDPVLVNAWGVAFGTDGYAWVAAADSGKVVSYDGAGVVQRSFDVPSATGPAPGAPTGIVANRSTGFVVTANLLSGPAALLVASEDGTISGWNPTVDPARAVLAADRTSVGAIYKGLAIGTDGDRQLLFATDFHNGRIDVFDENFQLVATPGTFEDKTIRHGFAPFGIRNIGGALYVTYAQQDAAQEDDVTGRGRGYVNVFDTNGFRLRRLATRGQLDAPWGLALAPTSFTGARGRILVGNFGDGRINAFDLETGRFAGTLKGADGRPLAIDGLWGLAFGNDQHGQPSASLYFAAGPGDEAHGLFGSLAKGVCAPHGH